MGWEYISLKALHFFLFQFSFEVYGFSRSEGESFSMSRVSSSSSLKSDDEFSFAYFNSFANRDIWFFATKSVVSNSLELFSANELEEDAS